MATIRLSDSQLRSPPACPALSVVIGTAERLLVRSPTLPFGRAGSLLASPSASLSPSEPARNSDLSLAHNDCSFPNHRSEVKASGLLLSCHAGLSREPFGRPLRHPLRFAPAAVGINAIRPVFPFQTRAPGCASDFRSPSGYQSLPDQSVQPGLLPESSPSEKRPVVLRSPQPNYK